MLMTISRRNFLRNSSMVSLSTIATLSLADFSFGQSSGVKKPSSAGTFPVPHQTTPLDKLTREMFAGVIGSTFVVTHPTHGRVDIYLKDVEDLSPEIFKSKAKYGIECFNLVFACQSSVELGQTTVTMDHEKFGSFDLLIVPGKAMRYGRDYSAIINRLFP
jgi:hypothetical protein